MVVLMTPRTSAVNPATSLGWLMGSICVKASRGITVAALAMLLFFVIKYRKIPVSLMDMIKITKGWSASGAWSSSDMHTVMMARWWGVAGFLWVVCQSVKVMCVWRARAACRRSSTQRVARWTRGFGEAAWRMMSRCDSWGMVV